MEDVENVPSGWRNMAFHILNGSPPTVAVLIFHVCTRVLLEPHGFFISFSAVLPLYDRRDPPLLC